jgi:predicted site-specific integrase-resolvase
LLIIYNIFELIEWVINEYSKGNIVIVNKLEETPKDEITKDILQIMNVYVAKVNGLRKYKNKMKNTDDKTIQFSTKLYSF